MKRIIARPRLCTVARYTCPPAPRQRHIHAKGLRHVAIYAYVSDDASVYIYVYLEHVRFYGRLEGTWPSSDPQRHNVVIREHWQTRCCRIDLDNPRSTVRRSINWQSIEQRINNQLAPRRILSIPGWALINFGSVRTRYVSLLYVRRFDSISFDIKARFAIR